MICCDEAGIPPFCQSGRLAALDAWNHAAATFWQNAILLGPDFAQRPGRLNRTFAFAMPRHSWFCRLVSMLLAVLVLMLTASVGLTVQRHTCRMSGRSKVNVLVADVAAAGNCGSQSAPPLVKDNCCDVSSHLHKLTAPAQELAAKVLVPAPLLAVWLPEATWARLPVVDNAEARGPRWFTADASPPPRGGRGLLAFVCTLVV